MISIVSQQLGVIVPPERLADFWEKFFSSTGDDVGFESYHPQPKQAPERPREIDPLDATRIEVVPFFLLWGH